MSDELEEQYTLFSKNIIRLTYEKLTESYHQFILR
jgi:hypothetical protein